ncbi:unnamed protein product [Boreogadus saida]
MHRRWLVCTCNRYKFQDAFRTRSSDVIESAAVPIAVDITSATATDVKPYCEKEEVLEQDGNAAAGAQAWFVSMTAASKQEAAQPLSEHYSEWLNACTLAKWMDRLISKGHTLQFTSVPPRFNGIVVTTLSSKDQQLSL